MSSRLMTMMMMEDAFMPLGKRTAVGALRSSLKVQAIKKKARRPSSSTTTPSLAPKKATTGKHETHRLPPKRPRCVVWKQADNYTLLRNGIDFDSVHHLVQSAKEGKLREEHLYIFLHRDPHVERNEMVPKYEGIFRCGKQWIRSQKGQLEQAYANSGRTVTELFDTFVNDKGENDGASTLSLPYLVDRFLCRKR